MAFERLTEEVRNVSALPNVIVGQASTLKATFDEAGSDIKNFINNFLTALEAFSAASNIGAMNGELQSNLQAIIDEFATSIANRYTKAEIDSKVSTETGDLVKTLAIDLNTGVFTITKKDGTIETIDTALEKVPTNFAFVEENGMYYLRVTNTDGTSTQVDVTTLFNDYTFDNSDSIAFSTVKDGNKATITAEIRDASIGIEKLSLTAVSQLEGYVSSASQSAQTATTKANEASESATSALNSANTAVNSANNAATSATSAQTSANNAATSASAASSSAANATSQATLSQSWAVGNTGARDGENTNNAKYWAEQAKTSVDSAMSDTSTNPVQNKVIKSYVDDSIGDIIIPYKIFESYTDEEKAEIGKQLMSCQGASGDFRIAKKVCYTHISGTKSPMIPLIAVEYSSSTEEYTFKFELSVKPEASFFENNNTTVGYSVKSINGVNTLTGCWKNYYSSVDTVFIPYAESIDNLTDAEKTEITARLLSCYDLDRGLTKICYLYLGDAYCPLDEVGGINGVKDFTFVVPFKFFQFEYRITYTISETSKMLTNITKETVDTVDSAMSDTSKNPVQNKVIKQYVDNLVGNIETVLQTINSGSGV